MFKLTRKRKGKGSVILLVEDDALLSSMLADELKQKGFKVILVDHGSEVMQALEKVRVDLILLDLIIPGIDGFEVLKLLKGKPKTASIPVVVISNLELAADVKSAKVLGAEKYFIKANSSVEEIVDFVQTKLAT